MWLEASKTNLIYKYLVAPLDAIRAWSKSTATRIVSSTTNDAAAAASAAGAAETAVVFINSMSGEGSV